MGEFVEQYYWTVYAADFIFRSACYVTFAILLVIIARRLKPKETRRFQPIMLKSLRELGLEPSNSCPRPDCGCTHQRDEVTGLPYGCTDSDPPKASE